VTGRGVIALLACALLVAPVVRAQEENQVPSAQSAAELPKPLEVTTGGTTATKTSTSPWDFTFGPQEDGTFGTTIKGSTYYSLAPTDPSSWSHDARRLFTPFIGVDADGGWNSAPDALNNFSVSLKPSLAIQTITPGTPGENGTPPSTDGPWFFGFLDLRQRFGHFKSEGDETAMQVNQSLLGAGVEFRITRFNARYDSLMKSSNLPIPKLFQPPSLSLTYYTERDTSADDADLPDGITDDTLAATLRTEIPLPIQCEVETVIPQEDPEDPLDTVTGQKAACPWQFSAKVTASWPFDSVNTDLEYLGDVALIYDTGSELKPVLRFRSGTEHGLQYDRQLILGVLMRLFE